MRKTTVYVPDDIKHALEQKARAERRSEADIIRDALVAVTSAYHAPPTPRLGLFHGPGNLAGHVDELLARGFGQE